MADDATTEAVANTTDLAEDVDGTSAASEDQEPRHRPANQRGEGRRRRRRGPKPEAAEAVQNSEAVASEFSGRRDARVAAAAQPESATEGSADMFATMDDVQAVAPKDGDAELSDAPVAQARDAQVKILKRT